MKNNDHLGKRPRSTRVEQNYQRTRREILQAAQQILLTQGVEAVTLASVAGELSLTKQALYHYFPSKESLLRDLVTTLLDEEVGAITSALDMAGTGTGTGTGILGVMINAFYNHYIDRLDAFKTVYCQTQLYAGSRVGIDKNTLSNEINPRTRNLFNVLENYLCTESTNKSERVKMRQLAFSAWLSALGLLTMLSIADSTNDPIIHSAQDLLKTLSAAFDNH